jgi:hypothetical protein
MAVERKYERDIDLLLAEEFCVSPGFADWFLSRTSFRGIAATVLDVFVSQSDTDGESDLVVLFEKDDSSRFALFIEDKIDAAFMPGQHARYTVRAQARRSRGEFAEFEIILCAPGTYWEASADAKLFQTFVSYEDIGEAFSTIDPSPRAAYRRQFFITAAKRAANTWRHIDDPLTNSFWEQAYDLATREYPALEMKEPKYSKGAAWIWFRPHDFPNMPRQVRLELKGNQGHADLVFPKTDGVRFATAISHALPKPMIAVRAGSTAVVRLRFEPFRVADGIEVGMPKIRQAFEALTVLMEYYRRNTVFLDQAAEGASHPGLEDCQESEKA